MAGWVWGGEQEASKLVLVVEEDGGMVDGRQHGALGALWGQYALHGEREEEA